jgi:starch synthase
VADNSSILCRYDFFLQSPLLGATRYETEFDWGGTHIWVSTCVVQGLRCFFIEPANGFFAVGSVYGRNDDAMRFEFFNKVCCSVICSLITLPLMRRATA